jgi:hypothetical protein
VNRGSTIEEHDTSGGYKFCAGTHYLSVWSTSNFNNRSGPSLMSHQFREFVESKQIKLMNSSPYYAQDNGQVEASNKVLIKITKKGSKTTPFELVYSQEAVLPIEASQQNLRVTGQAHLSAKEYNELMMEKIDDAPESQFKALEEIEKKKVKIAKAYNKCVMEKLFQVGDLVWKMILSLGTRSG